MFDDDEREQLPVEARAIHQRLLRDSGHWERQVPADTRIAEFARAIPQRMPNADAQQTRDVVAHRRFISTRLDMRSSKGQTAMFMPQRPGRALVASVAAIVVVVLIAGVLYAIRGAQVTSFARRATHTSSVPTSTPYPQGDYSATPGPLAQYVSKLYTTGEYPTDGTSIVVKSHFVVNNEVYVVMKVHGLPEGAHTISVEWYLGGVSLGTPASMGGPNIGDRLIYFSLTVPQPGNYMAKVYIDRPATDTSDSPSDPYLAGTVLFAVTPS